MSSKKLGLNKSVTSLIRVLYLLLGLAGDGITSPQHSTLADCTETNIRCAKTVSATVTNEGRIWFAWTTGQHLYINYSDDRGQTLSHPIKVNQQPETITARGENRPKIALDASGNIYLSWVKKLPEKWTADIRFAWSADQGKTFSLPLTINDDLQITSHSFNEMLVSNNGQVYISWLDGRHALAAREKGHNYTGTALYMASFNASETHNSPKNIHLADGSCVCCRLAMALNQRELPVLMWRHIFGDNIRDHALITLNSSNNAGQLKRVSYQNWQIDGCPHHGPSIISQQQGSDLRLHMSWFNDAPQASGLFYAHSDDEGKHISKVLHVAERSANPSHPHLALTANKKLQLVWQVFDGQQQTVKLIRSDSGEKWTSPELIAHYDGATDYPFLLTHPKGNLLLWHRIDQPLQLIEINE
ncbi:MAG: hypothetical protein ACJA0N_001763 [Pseudohongiellaceae bacterium]|jgi:hypothetical protein